MECIFLILILLCFIVTFIYNKKDSVAKKIFKSLFHTFYLAATSLFIALLFLSSSYDVQDKYPNLPMFEIFNFLGYASWFGIPLLYIIAVLIVMKIDKED